ncbi:hypothetical protein BDB00DRAFT_811694 [Zychaea mexicana]|uniref:uncharacterized protein n=1 Tax=Zychaea mexicana TaxID=64656 RepID=UPI0022FEA919|nr:uncharacterized protein BDB00DRAFT_811694 [Zychaea mexicana]KAI9495780.1 hypothetical protein BDB00DRAFT_811694 [Zychaea mexicana]
MAAQASYSMYMFLSTFHYLFLFLFLYDMYILYPSSFQPSGWFSCLLTTYTSFFIFSFCLNTIHNIPSTCFFILCSHAHAHA